MASDKIINSILETANKEADEILKKADLQALNEEKKIQSEAQTRIDNLTKQFNEDSLNIEKRAKLNAGITERKNLLETKRTVMNEAFDLAKKGLKNLSFESWAKFVTLIVLTGTDTDTEYIKVPAKDIEKYNKEYKNGLTLLEYINEQLKDMGHKKALKLDRNPAKFDDGLMLIGKYSDVNASFDVLIENQKELLENKVTNILFETEE